MESNNVAIIYDRLNPLTLGTIIALVKRHVEKIYVVDGADPRVSSIARSLGAHVIGKNSGRGLGLNKILMDYFDGAYVFLYGDGTHSPDRIPALLDQLKAGYDVAMGSRSGGLQVSENVLYLNNRRLKAGFSGFLACSSKCLDTPLLQSTGQIQELYENALRRGLKIQTVADEESATLELYRIGVVVPAYNEEALIGPTIADMPSYVDRIYVVDDCSTDRTADIVRGTTDPRVVSIRHETNRGVGAAIVTGYKKALEDEMDVIAVMAGDRQMDPEQLPRLLLPVIEGKADYVKGNRLLSRDMCKGMSAWRYTGNFLLTMITKIGSGYWHVADPQNGYTAISRRALEALDLDSVYTYYGYCNDLLIKLNAFGLRVMDVAMPARYGTEKSHIKYSTFILKVAPMLFRGFLWRLKTKYIVLDFNPLVLFYAAGACIVPVAAVLCARGLFQKLNGIAVTSEYALLSMSFLVWGMLFLLFAMVLDMQDNRGRIQDIKG